MVIKTAVARKMAVEKLKAGGQQHGHKILGHAPLGLTCGLASGPPLMIGTAGGIPTGMATPPTAQQRAPRDHPAELRSPGLRLGQSASAPSLPVARASGKAFTASGGFAAVNPMQTTFAGGLLEPVTAAMTAAFTVGGARPLARQSSAGSGAEVGGLSGHGSPTASRATSPQANKSRNSVNYTQFPAPNVDDSMHMSRERVSTEGGPTGSNPFLGPDSKRVAGMWKSGYVDGAKQRPHASLSATIGADIPPRRLVQGEEAAAADPRGLPSVGRRSPPEQPRARGAQYLPQISQPQGAGDGHAQAQAQAQAWRHSPPVTVSSSTPDLCIDNPAQLGGVSARTPPIGRRRRGDAQAPLRTPPRGFAEMRGHLCQGEWLFGRAEAPFEAPELSIGNPLTASEKKRMGLGGVGASGMRPSFPRVPSSLAMAAGAFELVNQVQRHSSAEELAFASPLIIGCSPQVARPRGPQKNGSEPRQPSE